MFLIFDIRDFILLDFMYTKNILEWVERLSKDLFRDFIGYVLESLIQNERFFTLSIKRKLFYKMNSQSK